jgi:hypothetical protein
MNQTAGWRHVSTATFSYSVPADLHRNTADAAGSHVAQFSNDEMMVTFDDGAYAGGALDSLAKYPNCDVRYSAGRGAPV